MPSNTLIESAVRESAISPKEQLAIVVHARDLPEPVRAAFLWNLSQSAYARFVRRVTRPCGTTMYSLRTESLTSPANSRLFGSLGSAFVSFNLVRKRGSHTPTAADILEVVLPRPPSPRS